MESIIWLMISSLILVFFALLGLIWAIKNGQYDDPEGAANRILFDDKQNQEKK